MSEPILAVDDLAVGFRTYGRTAEVLEGVSLAVREGQHVALVGESGCGKSVTMRTIMGTLRTPPAQVGRGRILFQGEDLLTMAAGAREALKGTAMSMIFQDPTTSLNPVFTVGTQLADVVKYADRRVGRSRSGPERRARILEVLDQVRLPDPPRIHASYPLMLSGGMRQRVLIAMALLNDPKLLIADEPGTALDVTTQAEILALLADLVTARSLALLMITHNLGVVRQMADYVYVMYAGTIAEHGPTQRIFENPSHPYTRALIDCVPKLSGTTTFKGIDGTLPDYADPPQGCRFAPRCPHRMPACDRPPSLWEVGPEHSAACWLYGP